ncbi:CotS family spore coat protein [Heliobacterium chlorum]|uniref:CotS family spore coat protein n=1 Tax=Heliobacterium chlorum TaxID=2698 RepID=A0ABR7T3R6_HELCL|nr:CotS family spore coat protein [Heliobacterium chlorum]MBC9784857.1 CotS family spore coat protein [Heliobacterium chlorum]
MEKEQESRTLSQWELDVLQEYPYQIVGAEQRGNTWRLDTDRGVKALYRYEAKAGQVSQTHALLEHLAARGFRRTNRFIRTRDGWPYVYRGTYTYVLTDWVTGRPADFRQESDLQRATQSLAEVHRLGAGSPINSGPSSSQENEWNRKLAERKESLQWYRRLAKAKKHSNEFEALFLERADEYERKAAQALQQLSDGGIERIAGEVRSTGIVCHRNWREENLRFNGEHRLDVIGWDACGSDLPVVELSQLIRRAMATRKSWEVDLGREILNGYEEISPLGGKEKKILLGLLAFPQHFWGTVADYFRGRRDVEEMTVRLREGISEEEQRETFLEEFRRFVP